MKQITLIAAILLSANLILEALSTLSYFQLDSLNLIEIAFESIDFLSQAAVTVFFIILYKNQKG